MTAELCLLHIVGDHDAAEAEALKPLLPCRLELVLVPDWNDALTPWPAPTTFKRGKPFGGHAQQTLDMLRDQTLPHLRDQLGPDARFAIGGYSLGGLFALIAAYHLDDFAGVMAASPSVWFPDWIAYAAGRRINARHVYLSLGDRESETRNPVMRQVADCMGRQVEILQQQGTDVVFEWNEGGHFNDPQQRTLNGWNRLLAQMRADA